MRAVVAIALCGCLRSTQYVCETSDQCGNGGTCEQPQGFCSVADQTCSSGRRFGDAAGSLSNTCVGGDTGSDGGPGSDGSGSDGGNKCPDTYLALAGAPPNQRYRVNTKTQDWVKAQSDCLADSSLAYLAIPEDMNELVAQGTLTAAKHWVGINDHVAGNYVDLKGNPAFLVFAAGQPDDNASNSQQCIAVLNNQMSDEKCGPGGGAPNLQSVCECDGP